MRDSWDHAEVGVASGEAVPSPPWDGARGDTLSALWRPRADPRLVLAGLGVCVSSVWLPWAHVQGAHGRRITGLELGTVSIGLPLIAVVAGAGLGLSSRISRLRGGAAVLAGVLMATSILYVVVVESVAGAIPRDVLPATVRRLTIDVSAGAGAWLACLGSGLLLVAATGVTAPISRAHLRGPAVAHLVADRWPSLLLLAATVGLAVSRYQPWLEGRAAGHEATVEGFALPWVGPGTLVLTWVLVVCCTVSSIWPGAIASLIATFAAWSASFMAAVLLLAGSTLGRARLAERVATVEEVPAGVAEIAPSVAAGSGAQVGFGASAVACIASLALLRRWAEERASGGAMP